MSDLTPAEKAARDVLEEHANLAPDDYDDRDAAEDARKLLAAVLPHIAEETLRQAAKKLAWSDADNEDRVSGIANAAKQLEQLADEIAAGCSGD